MTQAETDSLGAMARFDRLDFWESKPLEAFARLRREAPVFWCEEGAFWVLTKYADVKGALLDWETFSLEGGKLMGDNYPLEQVVEMLPDWAKLRLQDDTLSRPQQRGIVNLARWNLDGVEGQISLGDPPRNNVMRKLFTQGAFTPRLIARMDAKIERITDDLLDAIEDGAVADFTEAVGRPIGTYLMADLMELPRDSRDRFWQVTDNWVRLADESDPAKQAESADGMRELAAYVGDIVAHRRESPGQDLISGLLAAECEGERLTQAGVVFNTLLFMAASSSGNGHLAANMIHALAAHPAQRDVLIERPDLIPTAIEEIIRWTSPVWGDFRTATAPVELRGQVIDRDDYVMCLVASANRDEDVFERPNELDVTRTFEPGRGHLAFSVGAHACVGAPLARLEARIVLEKMLERFPRWEIAGEPTPTRSSLDNGYYSMPIRFLR